MTIDLIARATETVAAPRSRVWRALTDPADIRRYFFGSTVTSTWEKGAAITWEGEWQGKPYQDHGVILAIEPERTLQYTHFSPRAGLPDLPENHHTVLIELTEVPGGTRISLAQDHNRTEEERDHSEANWRLMLDGLKQVVEGDPGRGTSPDT